MIWDRSSIQSMRQKYDYLLLLVVTLSVISLINNQTLVFLVVGFIVIYVLLIGVYDKRIARKLILKNKKRSIRLFEGDNRNLEINLYNHSILPFLNATFSFTTNVKLKSDDFVLKTRGQFNHYHVPVILYGNSKVHLSIPIIAIKRGVTRIENIEIAFPHLMNFEQLRINYLENYQTEILVYPRPLSVAGIEEFPYNNFGNQVTPFSPFEDLLSPVGTRDYVQSDPFHRIHWKASAKNQRLQTKIYERNQNISWTLLINIAEASQLGNIYMSKKIEQFLSQAAYICQTITKKGYPIEIYINASRIGNMPFYLGEDSGREHLKKILELLARIEDDNDVIPIADVLHQVDCSIEASDMLIMIGNIVSQNQSYINKWNKQGNRVYQVINSENGAYLSEWTKEGSYQYGAK